MLHGMSNAPMNKKPRNPREPVVGKMRPEYDFSNGERAKYAARFKEGTNLVVLEPEVAAAFPTAEAVNAALRKVAGLD